jgi:hypothetical protein
MRIVISHPELAPDLVGALNETDCFAARTGDAVIEVFAPWLLEGGNTAHARTELLFFVRAWASDLPGFRARLAPR